MFNVTTKEIQWGDRTLKLETGQIARQADGAVMATYGQTVVLCTAVAKKEAKPDVDFFPLTIHYQEKAFAAGKIPGGFFKREGRPSEFETLSSRLIDRPIRPLFPDGFFNEVQVICTVLQHDGENSADIVAMIGASAALSISGVPFEGPIAGARVGYNDGNYTLNPSLEEAASSDLDLVVAGTESSVLMVESEANVLSEEIMLGAVEFGHQQMQPVISLIKELKKEAGKEDWEVTLPDHSQLASRIADLAEANLRSAYQEKDKQARVEKIAAAKQEAIDAIIEQDGDDFNELATNTVLKKLEKKIVRGDILQNRVRIDGRKEDQVRPIESQISLLPRTHGSALFTRGETQAVVVATLGTGTDTQIVDALTGEYKESFMLHYNFPPYCVGEASMLRSAGRREIGHGKLAWRALKAALPSQEDFPYTLRLVSEITESNGSSSMATVCGSTLAMMDAGVPMKAPVAGIAMGLIKEEDGVSVLSDILGDEDHLGDMDFKVAGTTEGITALQMDIKINGITTAIMKQALAQAKDGRIHILGEMAKAITEPKTDVSEHAPRIHQINIDKDRIGELIGPGGKVIREICETADVKIDIEDDGTVKIASLGGENLEKALAMIGDIMAEVEDGAIYDATVIKLFDFGVLVNFLGKNEGLVHISELSPERIETVEGAFNVDDKLKVLVIGFDRGKPRLSVKRVNQETGENISEQFGEVRPRGGDRGGRKGGGGDRRGGGDRGGKSDRPRRRRDNDNQDGDNNGDGGGERKKRRFF